MLNVSVQNFHGVAILSCQGRLVRGAETGLLCAAVHLPETAILDLTDVESIDAAGIGVLVSLQAAGVYLTLLNPSESVRSVLRLTEVDSIFAIAESFDEAVANASQSEKSDCRRAAAMRARRNTPCQLSDKGGVRPSF